MFPRFFWLYFYFIIAFYNFMNDVAHTSCSFELRACCNLVFHFPSWVPQSTHHISTLSHISPHHPFFFCVFPLFSSWLTFVSPGLTNSLQNIYVYCSREGAPDSRRNPKAQRQRKRPSKRCDCRWRVVLFQNSRDMFQFRRSLNPSASWHNHDMMPQGEMVKYWPPEVTEMIISLAGQRMATNDIRQRVQARFPEIPWNERRFYNRITEERKRTRYRETTDRVHRLTHLSVRLCSVAAGAEDMATKVEAELLNMLKQCCDFLKVPPDTIISPVDFAKDGSDEHQLSSASPVPKSNSTKQTEDDGPKSKSKGKGKAAMRPTASSSSLGEIEESAAKKRKLSDAIPKAPDGVKGALPVVVPSYTLYIKSETLKKSSSDAHQAIAETSNLTQQSSQDNLQMEMESQSSEKLEISTRSNMKRRSRADLVQQSPQEQSPRHLQHAQLPPSSQQQQQQQQQQSIQQQQSYPGHIHPMSGNNQNPYMYHTFPVPAAVRGGDPISNQDTRYNLSSPIPTYGMNQEFPSAYSMQPAFTPHNMQYGFPPQGMPPGSNIPQGMHPSMIPGTDPGMSDKQHASSGNRQQSIDASQQPLYVFDVQDPNNSGQPDQ